jgi:hypothetical protein
LALLLLNGLHAQGRAVLRGAVLHCMGITECFDWGPLVSKGLVYPLRILFALEAVRQHFSLRVFVVNKRT